MFNLESRDTATQTVTPVSGIVGPPHELTALAPNLDYEFRVQEVVNGVASPWSPWKGFRTAANTVGRVIVGSSSKVPSRTRQFLVGLNPG